MGQEEIYLFLKSKRRNNKWYSSTEINEQVSSGYSSTTHCLKKLRFSNTIRFKVVSMHCHDTYVYKFDGKDSRWKD